MSSLALRCECVLCILFLRQTWRTYHVVSSSSTVGVNTEGFSKAQSTCVFHPPADVAKHSLSSPHFHASSYALCVDLNQSTAPSIFPSVNSTFSTIPSDTLMIDAMSSFLLPRSLAAKQVLNSPLGISCQSLLCGGFNIRVFFAYACFLCLKVFPSPKVKLQNLMFV